MSDLSQQNIYFDRKRNKFFGITRDIKNQLKKAHKGVDVDAELVKMVLWLTSPKGLERRGDMTFILGWLGRVFPKPIKPDDSFDLMESNTKLGNLFKEYLTDLWKNKEHIFEINTIKR